MKYVWSWRRTLYVRDLPPIASVCVMTCSRGRFFAMIVPYKGRIRDVSAPTECRAAGRLPVTSPRPPVLTYGIASEATKKTFTALPYAGTGYFPRRQLCAIPASRPPDVVQPNILEHRIIRFRREFFRSVDGCKQSTYLAVMLEEPRRAVGSGLPGGDEEGPVRALLEKDLTQQHVSCPAVGLRQKINEMSP